MRHYSLPMTMTVEQLADYILTNRKDTQNHVEKIPLTPEEIQQLEHDSSVASRAILVLKQTKADFEYFLKKGTHFDNATGQYKPQNVTIPPTKGTEKLEANRDHAEKQILHGYREDVTALYLLPHPEAERMIMVDIEGNEWPDYSRPMSSDEVKQYGKPLLRAVKGQMKMSDDELGELNL
jgi:hypothetical protein